jgi:hypothetical protein
MIVSLSMIAQRTPPVSFINDSGPNRVKIDIRLAIDQCLAVIDDHAFKSIYRPEEPPPIVSAVIKPRKSLLISLTYSDRSDHFFLRYGSPRGMPGQKIRGSLRLRQNGSLDAFLQKFDP